MEGRFAEIENRVRRLSLEELRQLFEDAGLRLTHQRIMIYNAISRAKDHPSAETLYESLKKEAPTISLDTIYRTLSTLEELGLVKRVQVLDHIRFDPDLSRHHHFVCKKCKKIIDFTWPEFDTVPLPDILDELGEAQEQQVEIRGICTECSQKERAKK